jgi:hypothetical protein
MADDKAPGAGKELAMKSANFDELVESVVDELDPEAEQLLRAASDVQALPAGPSISSARATTPAPLTSVCRRREFIQAKPG